MANREKGIANATANPVIPIAGAVILPDAAASTSRVPIMGPVQEKDTNVRVNAIKNILNNPDVESALLSSFVVHDAGRVSSNAPKKETANNTSNAKNIILKTALVAISFKALAPNRIVIMSPKRTYMTMIDSP